MTSERNKALSNAESEQLGAWLAQELGTGPGPEAIAAQRLRLGRAARVTAGVSPRAKWWALSGGVVAAAAVVGGIGIVGKLQSAANSASARRPGISAEPLAGQREHEAPAPSHAESRHTAALTWRVSSSDSGESAALQTGPGRAANRSAAELGSKQLASSQLVSNQWLEARNHPVLLELADGAAPSLGQLEFGLGARVRVAQVNASELNVELERGIAEAALGAGASRVVVAAGPYRVSTRGGSAANVDGSGVEPPPVAYGVQWAPKSGALRVEVTRGEVEIVLPASNERHVVAAGKSLNLVAPDVDSRPRAPEGDEPAHKAHGRERSPDANLDKSEATVTEPSVAPAPNAPLPSPAIDVAAAPTVPAVSSETSPWRKFAENGQYSSAVKEAERVGFSNLEQTASASDLLLLADAARLGGAPQRARSVLTSLRSRYPGHTNSAVAAFTLGRMAQEQEHDDRRAIQWYRTYLKEEPGGRMAEGARARLLKATLRVGSEAEREQAARDYLANHPTGSSAAVARSVLSK